MGFTRQEYWSELPFPSPGDLPNPGIEPRSPTLQADALTRKCQFAVDRKSYRSRQWSSNTVLVPNFHLSAREVGVNFDECAPSSPPRGNLLAGQRFGLFLNNKGNGNPLQYSCLENPMDGGAWWATVHGSQRVRHDWATSLFTQQHREGIKYQRTAKECGKNVMEEMAFDLSLERCMGFEN